MGHKGNCWNNAVMVHFLLDLKIEQVWQKDYVNHEEAMVDVAEYIVDFCNHSTLRKLPPNAFEEQLATKQPIDMYEKIAHYKGLQYPLS